MSKLKNKVAIVTGASKGIGSSIAENLAGEGASVVVNYSSDQAGADRVVARIKEKGGQAIAAKGNITLAKDVASLFQMTKQQFGSIDIVVNNAGVYSFGALENFSEEEYHRVFDTNVLGPFLTCREAVKYFHDGGTIINISSRVSRGDWPDLSIYSASKGSLDVLTKVLSKELGPKNIRVNCVNPGATVTEGTQAILSNESFVQKVLADTPLGRLGQPEDIAKVVTFLASDDSSWLTGQVIFVSGG